MSVRGGRVNKRSRKRPGNARINVEENILRNLIANGGEPSNQNALMTTQGQEGDEDVENTGDGMLKVFRA